MKPIRTSEFLLQFASQASPLWLLPAVPGAIALAWWLYGKERRAASGASAILLPVFRCALVAVLVFLAFRPSLIWRRITAWPGRVILLADDSESMAARDTTMPLDEAALLYRQVRGEIAGAAQHFQEMAADMRTLVRLVHRFQALSAEGDRRQDEFWDQADALKLQIDETFSNVFEAASASAGLSERLHHKSSASVETIQRLQQICGSLFTGSQHPGNEPFESVSGKLREAAATLRKLQAAADREAEGEAADSLEAAAEEIRGTPRIELLGAALEQMREEVAERLPGQNFEVMRLLGGQRTALAEFAAEDLQPARGETRIADRLNALLSSTFEPEPELETSGEYKFPITTIVLLSDGRDLSGTRLASVSQAATRQQVPISSGAVGSLREPVDVAILEVVAPPYAVKDTPLRVRVRLRVSSPESDEIEVQWKQGTETLAARTLKEYAPDESGTVATVLEFSPKESGRFRYTVAVKTDASEVFPKRNNAEDFVVRVRDEKIRVLLADWKPRWETRFALNIFRRLEYVELNDVIVIVGEDGELQRGAVKGTWPQDYATLQLYDFVVLGALPAGLLTNEEWGWLRTFIEEDGKTVLLLGGNAETLDALHLRAENRDGEPSRNGKTSLPSDSPARTRATASDDELDQTIDLSDMRVTETGAAHPLTRALGKGLPRHPEAEIAFQADSLPLLLAGRESREAPDDPVSRTSTSTPPSDLVPILSVRYAGAGKIALLETDQLWKQWNPSALAEHGALYLNSVSWAVDGDALEPDRAAPELLLDSPVVTTRETLQVWVGDPPENAEVEAVSEGEVVATAAIEPAHAASELGRAAFVSLPAGKVELGLAGATNTEPRRVHVLERYPELHVLARNDELLTSLAADTGGEYGWFTDLPELLSRVEPKSRVETEETIYRLWDAKIVFALILLGLTIEWVWRKLAGLI